VQPVQTDLRLRLRPGPHLQSGDAPLTDPRDSSPSWQPAAWSSSSTTRTARTRATS
jgi:hypothetical protein